MSEPINGSYSHLSRSEGSLRLLTWAIPLSIFLLVTVRGPAVSTYWFTVDEGNHWSMVERGNLTVLELRDLGHGIFHYVLNNFLRYLNLNAFSARWISLLAGAGIVIVGSLFGSRLANKSVGFLGGSALAISAPISMISSVNRGYALSIFLCVLALYISLQKRCLIACVALGVYSLALLTEIQAFLWFPTILLALSQVQKPDSKIEWCAMIFAACWMTMVTVHSLWLMSSDYSTPLLVAYVHEYFSHPETASLLNKLGELFFLSLPAGIGVALPVGLVWGFLSLAKASSRLAAALMLPLILHLFASWMKIYPLEASRHAIHIVVAAILLSVFSFRSRPRTALIMGAIFCSLGIGRGLSADTPASQTLFERLAGEGQVRIDVVQSWLGSFEEMFPSDTVVLVPSETRCAVAPFLSSRPRELIWRRGNVGLYLYENGGYILETPQALRELSDPNPIPFKQDRISEWIAVLAKHSGQHGSVERCRVLLAGYKILRYLRENQKAPIMPFMNRRIGNFGIMVDCPHRAEAQ